MVKMGSLARKIALSLALASSAWLGTVKQAEAQTLAEKQAILRKSDPKLAQKLAQIDLKLERLVKIAKLFDSEIIPLLGEMNRDSLLWQVKGKDLSYPEIKNIQGYLAILRKLQANINQNPEIKEALGPEFLDSLTKDLEALIDSLEKALIIGSYKFT